jgi:membrane AbrB-like protein
VLNLLGAGLGPLAEGFRTAAMVLIGVSVGSQISRSSLALLRKEALPAAAVIATLIATGLALGWAMSRVTSLDLPTALLSGVPGGASTMPAIAHDLGGDIRLVAALHLARQLVVFLLVPPILGYLLSYSGRGRRRLVKRG